MINLTILMNPPEFLNNALIEIGIKKLKTSLTCGQLHETGHFSNKDQFSGITVYIKCNRAERWGITGSKERLHQEQYTITRNVYKQDDNCDVISYSIKAGSPIAVCYALVELGEHVSASPLTYHWSVNRLPKVGIRAIKINLPYYPYRRGGAMTTHEEVMAKSSFWENLLEMLVINRFNALTLWSLHPFPYMIQVDGYPEAWELSDSKFKEFKQLWKFIFKRAKELGIETYLMTWNIFVPPKLAEKWGICFDDREYHIGNGDESECVKRYNRQCIKQTLAEYENLTGFGTSLGERMENISPNDRERWIEDVVINSINSIQRDVRFIHRAPFSADTKHVRETIEKSKLVLETLVEYKFNWSHGHSSTELCSTHDMDGEKQGINEGYWDPPPSSFRMIWTVRNEDIFILRWAQPDFIRDHIKKNTQSYVAGYLIGSEGYIPANDYISTEDTIGTWKYLFEKQWHFYHVWGRLLYTPETDNEELCREGVIRYGVRGKDLMQALFQISNMPLHLASFYHSTWDYTLYSEGFLAPCVHDSSTYKPNPLIRIKDMIEHSTLDPRYLSIKDYVNNKLNGNSIPPKMISPISLAEICELNARNADEAYCESYPLLNNADWNSEWADVKIWIHLNRYFSFKLHAATAIGFAKAEFTPSLQKQDLIKEAKENLVYASYEWRALSEIADKYHRIVPYIERIELNHILKFHWRLFLPAVEMEVNDFDRELSPF